MRLILVLLLCGCPLPEDQFVLSGQAVNRQGQPRVDVELRLLRNQAPSELRCDALELLETTRTDEEGRYTFTLIRQQITRGVNARRFFRVEADLSGALISQSFWFPDADLELGRLEDSTTAGAWQITEARVDGRLAWRAEFGDALFVPDRPFDQRAATTSREWRTVPIDSLGRVDVVPVEWRFEGPWVPQLSGPGNPPASRGAECPFVDVTPCPLTDGRYVPFEFAEDTRTIVLNFKREVSVSPLSFHGLVLARAASRVRLEFNFVLDFDNWNRFGSSPIDSRLQELSAERCNDPGAFLSIGAMSFIKPVLLRIAFEDAEGNLVPIVSLAEISTR